MSRSQLRVTAVAAVLCTSIVAERAYGQRYVTMRVEGSGNRVGTFYIGTGAVGSSSVLGLFVGSFSGTSGQEAAQYLRDQMMPEEGIPGVGKRANGPRRVNATDFYGAGFQVFHADSVQFWASLDGANWVLIEPNGETPLLVGTPPTLPFTTVYFYETGSNGSVPSGSIPAISTVGLCVLVLLLLGAGAAMITRRHRAEC